MLKNSYIKNFHPKIINDFSWYKQTNQNSNEKYYKFNKDNFLEFLDFETRFNLQNKKAVKYVNILNKNIKFFKFDKPINKNKLKDIMN